MLTKEMLQAMPEKTIFATGIISNSPEGVYMTDEHLGRNLRWVAKRGEIHDWTIYMDWEVNTLSKAQQINNCALFGDKLTSIPNIRKLVPCDDVALSLYRF